MGSTQQLLPNGLTPKEAKFTNAILKQIQETGNINGTRAAQESLGTKSYGSAAVIAHDLLKTPKVKQTIQEALAEAGLTPLIIAERFKFLAVHPIEKVSADVQLRSLVEIAKLTGAYPTQKHANVSLSVKANLNNMQFADLEKELKRIDNEIKGLIETQSEANSTSDVAQ